MINKQQATKHNINIIENDNITSDKQALIKQIKELLPNVINSDNQLDIKALGDLLGQENTTSNNQGYELTFAGKGLARAEADKNPEYELKAEKEQSKNFDTTKNTVIRGDNLEVLKILKANYHNKIKMIYIDPPYNTKSENFVYKDNFKQSDESLIDEFGLGDETVDFLHNVYGTRSHSGWLSFIYPRLKLARELLTDDGVIFISIDDNEQANLKILCDEIFGEDNFVVNILWEKTFSPKNNAKHFSENHDYILAYSKNLDSTTCNGLKRSSKNDSRYKNPDNDPRGLWTSGDCSVMGNNTNNIYEIITPKGEKVLPPNGRSWVFSRKKFEELKKDNRIWFGDTGNNVPRFKRFLSEVKDNITPQTIWKYNEVGHSQSATQDLIKLFNGNNYFDFPKAIPLINKMLKLYSNKSSIILDFFAGSGTTADAVMQLNAEDGGMRKFVLVQLDEEIDKDKSNQAYDFCMENNFNPVISSITIERLNRSGDKILFDNENAKEKDKKDLNNLDIGYKVLSLNNKPQINQDENNLFKVINNRTSAIDTLINMMVATCKTFDNSIEAIKDNLIYKIDHEIYLLGNVANDEIKNFKDLKINIDGWADINLEEFLNISVDFKDNISIIY